MNLVGPLEDQDRKKFGCKACESRLGLRRAPPRLEVMNDESKLQAPSSNIFVSRPHTTYKNTNNVSSTLPQPSGSRYEPRIIYLQFVHSHAPPATNILPPSAAADSPCTDLSEIPSTCCTQYERCAQVFRPKKPEHNLLHSLNYPRNRRLVLRLRASLQDYLPANRLGWHTN